VQDSVLVCFVSPGISRSAEDASQIIKRINLYAKKFIESGQTQNCEAILLCSGLVLPGNENLPAINILKTYIFGRRKISLLRFLVKSYKVLSAKSYKKITLVSGDNYGALLICLLLKKLIHGNVFVQISIHGNPLTHNPYSTKTLARKLFFKLFVNRASSVRLVSGHLEEELGCYFGRSSEILVCPIPIELPPFSEKTFRKETVGVVGRLQYERGTDQLLGILGTFAEMHSNINFLVIGDGPERVNFESLSTKHPNLNVQILGSLSHSDVLSSYPKFNLLLSCALSEGYGLALREAILSGVPVVAKENLGTRALKETFPEMVFLFNSSAEAAEIITSKVNLSADPKLIKNYREIQIKLDANSLSALVNSWA
jgi:glycosyltransferase involved in cell wall biosynthesis